jgi:hypothetical protein
MRSSAATGEGAEGDGCGGPVQNRSALSLRKKGVCFLVFVFMTNSSQLLWPRWCDQRRWRNPDPPWLIQMDDKKGHGKP